MRDIVCYGQNIKSNTWKCSIAFIEYLKEAIYGISITYENIWISVGILSTEVHLSTDKYKLRSELCYVPCPSRERLRR